MSVIEVGKENLIYELSKNHSPAAFAKPGDTVILNTLDCYGGCLLPEGADFSVFDRRFGNPATGPVYVEGAKPGDTLKLKIEKIELDPVGILDIGEKSGALSGIFKEHIIKRIEVKDGIVYYPDSKGRKISVPARPMIGVIGTAPENEPVRTMVPMDHSGNMDCNSVTEGAVLYLPVFAEGALFAAGDMHAVMGDGEVGNCGLEIGGRITLAVDVIKNTGISFPVIENDDCFIAVAYADTLDEAAEKVSRQMFFFLTEKLGLSGLDAAMAIDMYGDLSVCQIVNPKKTVRMAIPKALAASLC